MKRTCPGIAFRRRQKTRSASKRGSPLADIAVIRKQVEAFGFKPGIGTVINARNEYVSLVESHDADEQTERWHTEGICPIKAGYLGYLEFDLPERV